MLKLNAAGKMIANVFLNLADYYKDVIPDTYIVMPDHFHGIIIIGHPVGAGLCARPNKNILGDKSKSDINRHSQSNSLPMQTSTITGITINDQLSLGKIIRQFKSFTTTQYITGVKNNQWKTFYEKLWQRGYYDHIVKDKKELFTIRKYITNNPLYWEKHTDKIS